MAAYSATKSVHETLVADTVDEVTISGWHGYIEVINRSGNAELFVTLNGDDPEVLGDNTDIVTAAVGASLVLETSNTSGGDEVVKIISGGAESYSVVGRPGDKRVRN